MDHVGATLRALPPETVCDLKDLIPALERWEHELRDREMMPVLCELEPSQP